MDVTLETLTQAAYALGVGALIGLERSFDSTRGERTDDAEPAPEPAGAPTVEPGEYVGLRTFSVLSLAGFTAALLGDEIPAVPPVMLGGVAVLVVAMYVRAKGQGLGVTTEAAAIGTCALGMLCHYHPGTAAVLGVVVTVVLAAKRFTHSTVSHMRRIELTATLQFLAVVLVILPLLPDRTFDPYEALNPYKVGLLVVLTSGISYVGYFLTKFFGARRGLALTGVLGGLTSSTAVTAAMSQQAKESSPDAYEMLAAATLAANATMFARVVVIVAVLDMSLVQRLGWSVGSMAVVAAVATGFFWLRSGRERTDGSASSSIQLKNPFALGPALKFAAFFVVILFVLKISQRYLGESGVFTAAVLSGLAEVDAITLSLAEQARAGDLTESVATIGITIAVVSNSVSKTGIAIYSGGWKFGRYVAAGLGAATVVGLAIAFLM
ncbi:MAG: MgtC/SapB family protein [Sandaracinaceae bacterium]